MNGTERTPASGLGNHSEDRPMKDGLVAYLTKDGRLCLAGRDIDAVQVLDNLAAWGYGAWGRRTDDDSEMPVLVLYDVPVHGPRIEVELEP